MDPTLSEWLNLILRWSHVVLGVLWIGQTALFSWLDSRLTVEAPEDGGPEKIWMVHSGGFYVVEKQKRPQILPKTLHWFRWEAALTWLSGMVLLTVVYYMGGLMVDESQLSLWDDPRTALWKSIGIGVGTLVLGWVIYDLLWISPLARFPRLASALSLLLAFGTTYGLAQVLSGRAAYIHVGALFGTIMAANVWVRILPAQKQMLAAARAGDEVDLTLGARAKQRSGHNTFLALPVIFIMISSHVPTISYGHRLNWLMLVGFILVGFAARYAMNRYNQRPA